MSLNTLHVVFKTHLDIGFTNLARNVVENYFDRFIPSALQLARTTREQGGDRFIWTTGSWLIYEYLEKKSGDERKRLVDAIVAGDIAWHALPFTTHTALADASLFRHGLSLSRSLDARFGRKTIAAKMTDVPGHTRAMVPLLREAGVELLHIGVNGASTPPKVPPVFRWQHTDGSEVVVIYESVYGGTRVVPGVPEALAFGHTNDNHGPQGQEEISRLFSSLREQFPSANVIGSTMDAFTEALVKSRPDLPLVTSEIGDSWIHGVGTDPLKVAKFKGLSRLRRRIEVKSPSFAASPVFSKFSTSLLLVAEHTWGRDLKRWKKLEDGRWVGHVDPTYETSEFLKKRALGLFREWEATWLEQREYLESAVETLTCTQWGAQAREIFNSAGDVKEVQRGLEPATADQLLRLGVFEVVIHPESGALKSLRLHGHDNDWAGKGLGLFQYQVFGGSDYERFYHEQYNKDIAGTDAWARADFTKPGLHEIVPKGECWTAKLAEISLSHSLEVDELIVKYSWDSPVVQKFGPPAKITVRYQFQQQKPEIRIIVNLENKQACRIAEALWWGFFPADCSTNRTHLTVMGERIDVGDVVFDGSRSLHACEAVTAANSCGESLRLELLTAALLAPGRPSLLDFHNRIPDVANDGFHVNLFNNVWGTNFPMWHDEDVSLEFRLSLEP